MLVKIAVGVGYVFAVVPSEEVHGIKLKSTDEVVEYAGETYPLYIGAAYEDSRKIDAILDSGKYEEMKRRVAIQDADGSAER